MGASGAPTLLYLGRNRAAELQMLPAFALEQEHDGRLRQRVEAAIRSANKQQSIKLLGRRRRIFQEPPECAQARPRSFAFAHTKKFNTLGRGLSIQFPSCALNQESQSVSLERARERTRRTLTWLFS